MHTANSAERVTHRLAILLLPALLAACGSHSGGSAISLPPTPPPQYGIGDSYSFSDGSSATVVFADPNRVRWKGSAGEWVTTDDVMLPSLSWHSGNNLGERALAGNVMLFPLEPGKSVLFSATSTMRSSFGGPSTITHEQWRCNVHDAVNLETQAGRFPTWRVDCDVAEQPQAGESSETRRSYYYAPEIGYFVRRVEHLDTGDTRVVDLVRYTSAEPSLPAAALRLRVASIQSALERDVSGAEANWRDPSTGAEGTVEPLRTLRSQQYGWCRDFAERIDVAGRIYTLGGTGCRNRAGSWDIVALAPTTNGSG
jgi:17 kDa outer membrane surface antigen